MCFLKNIFSHFFETIFFQHFSLPYSCVFFKFFLGFFPPIFHHDIHVFIKNIFSHFFQTIFFQQFFGYPIRVFFDNFFLAFFPPFFGHDIRVFLKTCFRTFSRRFFSIVYNSRYTCVSGKFFLAFFPPFLVTIYMCL